MNFFRSSLIVEIFFFFVLNKQLKLTKFRYVFAKRLHTTLEKIFLRQTGFSKIRKKSEKIHNRCVLFIGKINVLSKLSEWFILLRFLSHHEVYRKNTLWILLLAGNVTIQPPQQIEHGWFFFDFHHRNSHWILLLVRVVCVKLLYLHIAPTEKNIGLGKFFFSEFLATFFSSISMFIEIVFAIGSITHGEKSVCRWQQNFIC